MLFHLMGLLSMGEVADLDWMAGYWLDCTGEREASEVWSDPRHGLMTAAGLSSPISAPTLKAAPSTTPSPKATPPSPFPPLRSVRAGWCSRTSPMISRIG